MEHKALHRPFELSVSDLEHWNERPLVHHFFELVQVMEGTGVRTLNLNRYPYAKGHIFLYTPLDCRGFESHTPTRLCSIRFSEVFLHSSKSPADKERTTQWLQQLEHIFFHHNRFEEVQITHKGDCGMIGTLIQQLITEYELQRDYHEENLQHLVTLMLNILMRNVAGSANARVCPNGEEPVISRMLLYIRKHIGDSERLRVDHLAATFNLSVNYVGEFFRKATGESLQHYISQHKIRLVQHRLLHSNLTIGQIADELGFNDESHLGRQFRRHSGVSPAAFRKTGQSI
ncbi:AraC family transcriptional regulator [Chitinophaga sp. sic0106]|uniref:AraC family transcriptional regulator n=1 Tax=Chitinophaga sp. sic0106 TaxID=2854785 RepID=UPI001C445DFE|nr:AraC family transcriptional regulator [Chitinophaga sp. sic0106]MBV7530139.1 AraC family transcriptional regulator [Chitinophaga sp. sic0106]